jgi:hypothetical protein
MDEPMKVGVLQPYLAPMENLARAIENRNKEKMLRALRQIESVTGFYRTELEWRDQQHLAKLVQAQKNETAT